MTTTKFISASSFSDPFGETVMVTFEVDGKNELHGIPTSVLREIIKQKEKTLITADSASHTP